HPGPEDIRRAAADAVMDGYNQYPSMMGIPELRQAIAAHYGRWHGLTLDPMTEGMVTSGGTEALTSAILAVVEPGDEVVVFEPTYDAYVPDILMAGGIARPVALRPPHWTWDPAELARAFSPRTRAVILNTPHNPTGKMFSRAELEELAALARAHDALVISDEVYSELTFDGAAHVPIATLPGMRERTITIDSMGKTFSVTGWKVGWAIAPAPLTRELRAIHQFVTFTNSVPFQEALADGLALAEAHGYYDELRADYTARRDRLAAALRAAGLPPLPTQGAYFLLADPTPFGFVDDVAFCRHLCTDVGVAAIPTSVFHADPAKAPRFARFCFAKRDETIDAAAVRLRKLEARH
ncbi:MAG: aminotransferase class, partial [Myxococcales bacterium]|nr:aminotransferase class [Myxococcales bacterium]